MPPRHAAQRLHPKGQRRHDAEWTPWAAW